MNLKPNVNFHAFIFKLHRLFYGSYEDQMSFIFGLFDRDRNGFLSASDVNSLFEQSQNTPIYEEVNKVVTELITQLMFTKPT